MGNKGSKQPVKKKVEPHADLPPAIAELMRSSEALAADGDDLDECIAAELAGNIEGGDEGPEVAVNDHDPYILAGLAELGWEDDAEVGDALALTQLTQQLARLHKEALGAKTAGDMAGCRDATVKARAVQAQIDEILMMEAEPVDEVAVLKNRAVELKRQGDKEGALAALRSAKEIEAKRNAPPAPQPPPVTATSPATPPTTTTCTTDMHTVEPSVADDILAWKTKALALKRSGDKGGALAALRHAKELEASMMQ